MTGPAWPAVIGILAALILVSSGLFRRRLSQRRTIALELVWIAIIAMTWAAVAIGLRLS